MTAKMTIRIENHQPVPLRPLRELMPFTNGQVLFLVPLYDGSVPWDNGIWVIYDDSFYFIALDGYYLIGDLLDLDKTMARLRQPGEVVVATYGD